jgi:hypothetical protein
MNQANVFSKWLIGIFSSILFFTFLVLPIDVSAHNEEPDEITQQQESGFWRLISTDTTDTWQGDKFHGLDSIYSVIDNGNTIGAEYIQYSIKFRPDDAQKIDNKLNGTCTWNWQDGSIPDEIIPGKSYPYSLMVNGEITGRNKYFVTTVKGFTQNKGGEGGNFVELLMKENGEDLADQKRASSAISLQPGNKKLTETAIILTCQVDIITVTRTYLYEWASTGCNATLTLPDAMEPGKSFSPEVSVVDSNLKPIEPQSEKWFYDGTLIERGNLKWNGEAATLRYEYICPLDGKTYETQINIPGTGTCTASISLPSQMEPGKSFTPKATIVDKSGNPVTAQTEKWFYNGTQGTPMTWDGNAALVEYEFICPLDGTPGRAQTTINPKTTTPGWLVVAGGLGLVAAAALAAIGAGAVMMASGRKKLKKDTNLPKYILQLDKRSLEVRIDEKTPLTIRAWRINPDGSIKPAPETAIHVTVPASPGGLMATPQVGQGVLVCYFSIPKPTVCEVVVVSISASARGFATQTSVAVKIVPTYELNLKWHDPQADSLKPDGKEIYAYATLTAKPLPDAKTTPDDLASRIKLLTKGPNATLICLKTSPPANQKPYVQKGALWIPLSMPPLPPGTILQNGSPTLIAQCDEGGKRIEKNLEVKVSESGIFDAWAQGKKNVDAIYVESTNEWAFGGLTVYFHDPLDENKIVPPLANLGNPELLFTPPDILDLVNYGEVKPGYFSGDILLKQGVDLEKFFGPELDEKDARITLVLNVKDDNGKTYTSKPITYQICPTVELVVINDPDSETEGHEYYDVELDPFEFVADGEDEVEIYTGYRRTDHPAEEKRFCPFGKIKKINLQGPEKTLYLVGSRDVPFEPIEDTPGLWKTKIKTKKPLLFTQSHVNSSLSLDVLGELVKPPPNYRIKPKKLDNSGGNECQQTLKPCFLHLSLWVIPGWAGGTSIAGAVLFLPRKGKPVNMTTFYELDLTCRSNGQPLTSVPKTELYSRVNRSAGMRPGNQSIRDWLKAWRLDYPRIESWTEKGIHNIYCRVNESSEAVNFTIDVEENGSWMFAQLIKNADSPGLALNNPEWENSTAMWLVDKGLLPLPEFHGAFYNIRSAVMDIVFGKYNYDEKYYKYTCGKYSKRITSFIIDLRNYRHDTITKMNGIETMPFQIPEAHDYAGIYLSGMSPTKNPIFIDPWYRQKWDETATGANFGYKFQAVKFYSTTIAVLSATALVIYYAYSWISKIKGVVPEKKVIETAVETVKNRLMMTLRSLAMEIGGSNSTYFLQTPRPDETVNSNGRYPQANEFNHFKKFTEDLENQKTLPYITPVPWPNTEEE